MPSWKKIIVSGSNAVLSSVTASFQGNLTGTASFASTAPYSGLTGTVPTWNQNTTGNAATATTASFASTAPYSGLTGTVPTWNQNTTGNAATATSASAAITSSFAHKAKLADSASFVLVTYNDQPPQASQYWLTVADTFGTKHTSLLSDSRLSYFTDNGTLYSPSFSGSFTGSITNATSASFAPNFANTNLSLNDNRTHNLNSNNLTFTATDDESIVFNHTSGGTFEINGSPTIQTTGQLLHSVSSATGNIGIGTQTTTARLHVSGTSGVLLRVQNGSTSALMVSSSGNVGIGTTNPTAKLHLFETGASDVIFRITPLNGSYDPLIQLTGQGNTIATEGFEVWYSNNVGDVHLSTTYPDAAAAIRFHTATGASKSTSNERMTIAGGGNVGIGITNPARLLDINGTTNFRDAFYFSNGGVGYTTWGTIDGALALNIQAASGYAINLGTNASTGRVVITSGGNVGIGTVSPIAKLYVSGSSDVLIAKGSGSTSNTTILAVDGNNGRLFEVSDDLSDSLFSVNTIAGLPVMEAFADYTVVMGSYNKSDLVVTGSNIGIGTPNPQRKLDVYDSGSQIVAQFSSSNATSTRIKFSDANTGAENVNVGAIGTRFAVWTNNIERLSILSGGNVGIGSSAPGHALSVLGTVSASAFLGLVTNATSASFATSASYANNAGNAATANFATTATSASFASTAPYSGLTGTVPTWNQNTTGNAATATTASFASTAPYSGLTGTVPTWNQNTTGNAATATTASFASTAPYSGLTGTVPTWNQNTTGNAATATSASFATSASNARSAITASSADTFYVRGSVGIGIINPTSKLHVSGGNGYIDGNLTVTGTITAQELYVQFISSSTIYSTGSNKFGDATNDNQFFTGSILQSGSLAYFSGNVGIGTASPNANLEINPGSYSGVKTIISNGTNGQTGEVFQRWAYTSTTPTVYRLDLKQTVTSNVVRYNFSMINASTAYDDVLVLDRGNVGIGTTNPSNKLEIVGGVTATSFTGSLLGNASTATSATSATSASFASTAPYSGLTGTVPTWNQNTTGNAATATSASAAITSSFAHKAKLADSASFVLVTYNDQPPQASQYWLTVADTFGTKYTGLLSDSRLSYFTDNGTLYSPSFSGSFTGSISNAVSASFAPNFANTNLSLNNSRTHNLNSNNLTFTATDDESIVFNHTSGGTFEINGSPTIQTTGVIQHNGSGYFTGNIGIGTTATTTARLHVSASTGNIILATAAGSDILVVSSSGNVGIGTTNPVRDLQIGSLASVPTATPKTLSLGGTFSNSAGSNVKLRVYEDGTFIGGMSVSSGQMEVNTWSTGRIAFYRGTTQTMIIDATGSVGIGTATPVARMDISGSTVIRNTLTVNRSSVETYGALNVWDTTAGSGTSRIADFTNGTDVNLNFYTTQVGAATKFAEISSYSTIPLVLNNQSGGNVGIGTNSPSGGKLHIDGADPFLRVNNTTANNHGIKISYNYSETHGLHLLYNANAATASIDNTYPITVGQVWGDIYFRQNSGTGMIPRMMIKADGGNVGINTIVPTAKLHVVGDIKATLANTNQANAVMYNSGTGLLTYVSTGSIGVGTATNADNIFVSEDATNAAQPVLFASNTEGYYRARGDKNDFNYNPATNTLTVVTLNAQEKSFSIPHQGLPGKKLVYGVLEGPEHSVYVRGKSTERVIKLPEEWEWLVDEDSITVSLTPIGEPNAIYVEEIADNKIYVNSNVDTIKYFYHVYATRKDVKPLKTIQ